MASKGDDGFRLLNPKRGRKKRFATILAEYLGLGEVLSILCEEERGDNVVKKFVQPI